MRLEQGKGIVGSGPVTPEPNYADEYASVYPFDERVF